MSKWERDRMREVCGELSLRALEIIVVICFCWDESIIEDLVC